MDDTGAKSKARIQRRTDIVDHLMAILCAFLVVIILFGLPGCHKPEERQLVLDTDACLKQDKRAVMICPHYQHCYIECREKKDGS